MRDCKLFYSDGFDIDLEADGSPVYTDTAGETNDQRAAVACVIIAGTIPGALDVGVHWGNMFTEDKQDLLKIDNECKQMIENCSTSDGQATEQYIPVYTPNADGTISVTTIKGMGA